MNKIFAHILLFIFIGFITSLSVNYSNYLKILNGGAAVEDVNTIPEEHHEDAAIHEKTKNFHAMAELLRLCRDNSATCHAQNNLFSLQENTFFDVPFSPPEINS